ncbi:F-box protein At2g23160-like [Bidens hawaiensis]|uniref:F-box protein At2g23160-like n=1 Tax=Bidens hawaiensis TaxID=980011 RepID=UPI00404A39E2
MPRPLPELPPEITLDQILPRLPGKSILRFKCVSKQWYAFLTTPMFKNLHFDHSPNKLLLSSTIEPCKFFTIDCESPKDGLTAIPSLPFETSDTTTIKVLSSFHGLVCVGIKINRIDEEYYSGLKLWNPLTGECSTILYTGKYHIKIRALGLYYSSLDDDYRLLRVGATGVYIYSLKSDSWRKLGHSKYDMWWSYEHWSQSIWLNDKLYFLREYKGSLNQWQYQPSRNEIITFDTKTEKFSEIATPSFVNARPSLCSLAVVRGCIHLFVSFCKEGCLWKMDEDGYGRWTKVATYSHPESFLTEFEKVPIHMMRNGNLIMHSSIEGHFCEVDLEKGIKHVSYSYASSSMYRHILLQGKYVETFVSPNRSRSLRLPS